MLVSIVIPSIKKNVLTLKNLDCPFPHEVIVIKEHGLGKGRNEGFRRTKGDLVVLVDDDLIIDPKIWKYILNLRNKEFAMLDTGNFPITRVFAIYKKDFWLVGGFDESLRYSSEDREFYSRAVLKGLKFKPIPLSLVAHIKHKKRSANIHSGLKVCKDNVNFILKYLIYFPKLVFKQDFLNRIRSFQFRTLILQFFYFYWIILFE